MLPSGPHESPILGRLDGPAYRAIRNRPEKEMRLFSIFLSLLVQSVTAGTTAAPHRTLILVYGLLEILSKFLYLYS